MDDPQRILLIRPSALGDVCRTVPVVAALRQQYPNAKIEWMIQRGFEDSVRLHPAVDAIVPFPRQDLAKDLRQRQTKSTRAFLSSLRDAGYDMVIDAQGLARSGLFMRTTRAPRRIGYKQAQEFAWLAANERVDAPRDLHTVDRMLLLAQQAGADVSVPDMRLYADQDAVSQVVIEHPERFAVLAPTSRWASKRWADERFAELATRLLSERIVERVVLVGAPRERGQCRKSLIVASEHPQMTDRVGSTSIASLMALISRASLVVANDSAALHMAVGFDRPIVGLFGPTDNALVGPYQRSGDVLQHRQPSDPMDHKDDANASLMDRITVDETIQACRTRLGL
ncbi:MAG: glycosyltransferase family 9 protein [Phycisphaerales bacterium]